MNSITSSSIKTIATQIMELVKEKLTELGEETTSEQLEQTTRRVLYTMGGEVMTLLFVDQQKETEQYPEGERGCPCGQQATYERMRSGQFHTMFGTVECERAYYLCEGCRHGHYPFDQRLDVSPNEMSPLKQKLAAEIGVQLSFRAASRLFEKLTLESISDKSVAKACRSQGKKVVSEEESAQQKAVDSEQLQAEARTVRAPVRLYGSLDATKINVRHLVENGSEVRWRDLKVGAWYEAAGVPPKTPDGTWEIVAKQLDYFADMTVAREFGSLVWATGVQRHAHLARELIFIADGAEWIWNIVDDNFPHAVQILDWFHAVEYLMPVAKLLFDSAGSQLAWVKQMKTYLWEGKLPLFFDQLKQHIFPSTDESATGELIRKTYNYFSTHQQRIRYAHFRSQGYQIGSGTIESAAKQIGLMRMKVPGAIWQEDNAPLIAKARASFLSHHSPIWESLPLAA